MTTPVVLTTSEDPTIEFHESVVVKYQPKFFFGIRECVYYSTLHHPHVIHTTDYKFIKYMTQSASTIDDGIKITFPRYISIDAIFHQMTSTRIERLFMQVADALAYLEENEILQSDVKEANIFYDTRQDRYLLADFDLAFYSTECFVNRVATPSTRPPEQAYTMKKHLQDEWKLRYGMYPSQYDVRKSFASSMSTAKGDVFSLGVTVATLLIQEHWYSDEEDKQSDKVYYARALTDLKVKLSLLSFKYKDILMECLEFDYEKRPTCVNLARRLGTLHVYTSVKTIPRDDFNVYRLLLDEFKTYTTKIDSKRIVRSTRTANMLATFYSIKQLNPRDPKIYFCYAYAGLILSALLCSDGSHEYPYPGDPYDDTIMGLFIDSEGRWFEAYGTGEPSQHETHYGIQHKDTTTPDDLYTFIIKNYESAMVDICVTLDFKLLF